MNISQEGPVTDSEAKRWLNAWEIVRRTRRIILFLSTMADWLTKKKEMKEEYKARWTRRPSFHALDAARTNVWATRFSAWNGEKSLGERMNEALKWVMEIPKRASRRWVYRGESMKGDTLPWKPVLWEVDEWRNLLAWDSLSNDPSGDVTRCAKHLARTTSLKSQRIQERTKIVWNGYKNGAATTSRKIGFEVEVRMIPIILTAKPIGSIVGVRMRIKFRKSINAEVKSVEEWEDSIA